MAERPPPAPCVCWQCIPAAQPTPKTVSALACAALQMSSSDSGLSSATACAIALCAAATPLSMARELTSICRKPHLMCAGWFRRPSGSPGTSLSCSGCWLGRASGLSVSSSSLSKGICARAGPLGARAARVLGASQHHALDTCLGHQRGSLLGAPQAVARDGEPHALDGRKGLDQVWRPQEGVQDQAGREGALALHQLQQLARRLDAVHLRVRRASWLPAPGARGACSTAAGWAPVCWAQRTAACCARRHSGAPHREGPPQALGQLHLLRQHALLLLGRRLRAPLAIVQPALRQSRLGAARLGGRGLRGSHPAHLAQACARHLLQQRLQLGQPPVRAVSHPPE